MTQAVADVWPFTVKSDEPRVLFFDAFGVSKEVEGSEICLWLHQDIGATSILLPYKGGSDPASGARPYLLDWRALTCRVWRMTDTHCGTGTTFETTARDYEQLASQAEPSGANTAPPSRVHEEQEKIDDHVDCIFRMASGEYFEDGMYTRFSRELLKAVEEYGNRALSEITYLILHDRVGHEVASEALRWLGRISDIETYGWRLWLMEKSLSSPSYLIRDGAVLGLASMGDTTAILYLREAANRETVAGLREDMYQALEELEALLGATTSQSGQKV